MFCCGLLHFYFIFVFILHFALFFFFFFTLTVLAWLKYCSAIYFSFWGVVTNWLHLYLQRTLTADRMTDWDLWPGYMISIRQYEQDIMLCVEITHKVMRTDTVLDMINYMMRQPRPDQNSQLKSAVQGLLVLTDYNNRTYLITDVDFDVTPQSLFSLRTGRVLSYSQYYKEVCFNFFNWMHYDWVFKIIIKSLFSLTLVVKIILQSFMF